MLILVIRKMINNKWTTLCLLIGAIIAVAMVSSVPMYTESVLQRTLTKDLELYHKNYLKYPGRLHIESNMSSLQNGQSSVETFQKLDRKLKEEVFKQYNTKTVIQSSRLSLANFYANDERSEDSGDTSRFVKLEAKSELPKHAKILSGKMFSSQKTDGAYEAIVTQKAMQQQDVFVGKTYLLRKNSNDTPIKVKIVGVFTAGDVNDVYWSEQLDTYSSTFIIDYSLFTADFASQSESPLNSAQWDCFLDYKDITVNKLSRILSAYENDSDWINNGEFGAMRMNLEGIKILIDYQEREETLRTTLWILQVPVLLMLVFYIFMISQLIVEHESNEIVLLKSRGASRWQILKSYILESLLLSGGSLILGPPLGYMFCKILGSANGFLEFVQRSPVRLSLDLKNYLYSVVILVVFIITMLIPVYRISKTSIVLHKQKKVRAGKNTFWKKIFLDFILIGISMYGIYGFNDQLRNIVRFGSEGMDMSIDPLLYIISTLFIFGAGLLFLRVFPYIIGLIFRIGRKFWSPGLYASFIQVERSGGREQFIMLFIILTLSVGIYSANTARTVNTNIEEKIRYANGADIKLRYYWGDEKKAEIMRALRIEEGVPTVFKEPPFTQYSQLSGVEMATKVINRGDAKAGVNGKSIENVHLMGVIPHEFARVAWFRNDLLPYHWFQYLNLLSRDSRTFLVSTSFKEEYEAELGDAVSIKLDDQSQLQGIISGFVDYWPGFNPNERDEKGKRRCLVVGDFNYINNNIVAGPYEAWIKKEKEDFPGSVSNKIYRDIEAKGYNKAQDGIIKNVDTTREVIEKKNDPTLQGTNGALTLGFIITMIITAIGFLIYWIISIKNRALQFGIFRAMGLSLRNVIGMIICEQILITIVAIFVGIIVGGVACDLFIPLLQVVYGAADQVPPFNVIFYRIDYIRLYILVGLMLMVGFAVLASLISKIKISQAIKLGED